MGSEMCIRDRHLIDSHKHKLQVLSRKHKNSLLQRRFNLRTITQQINLIGASGHTQRSSTHQHKHLHCDSSDRSSLQNTTELSRDNILLFLPKSNSFAYFPCTLPLCLYKTLQATKCRLVAGGTAQCEQLATCCCFLPFPDRGWFLHCCEEAAPPWKSNLTLEREY